MTQPDRDDLADNTADHWTWHERLLVLWDRASVRWFVVLIASGVMVSVVLLTRSAPRALPSVDVTSGGQPLSVSSSTSSGTASASSTSSATVVVDVAGPVRKPGVITLPAGSRVADAIAAAGGIRQGTPGVNLARVLVDGEQIVVGNDQVTGQAGTPVNGTGTKPSGVGAAATAKSKVRLNTATATELETLPRIGPVTAAKIIEYRDQNGGFRSVDQLRDVSGVGEVTFAGIAPLVEL